MSKPVSEFENRIRNALEMFERETGCVVKNIKLHRLDKPVIFRGSETDLVNIEIAIK